MCLRTIGVVWVVILSVLALRAGELDSWTPEVFFAVGARVDPVVAASGLTGLVVTLWLVGAAVESVVAGGLFASLRRGVEEDSRTGTRGLLECVREGFPRVFLLRITEGAAELCLVLLGVSVSIAIAVPFASYGGLATWSSASKAAMIAVPTFIFMSLWLLARLTFQIAAAPLFLDDTTVGTAIADGARFLLARLAGIYKILVFAATLLLVPLFAYWGWAMLESLWGIQTVLSPLFSAGRLVGQLVVYTATSLVAVLFYGALFAFYAVETGAKIVESTAPADRPRSPERPDVYDETTRIGDLLPERSDRIVDVDELPGWDVDEASRE